MEYFSALKRSKILIHTSTWRNLENIMLSEIREAQSHTRIYLLYILCEISRIGKSIEIKSTFMTARDWREGEWGMIANVCGVSL